MLEAAASRAETVRIVCDYRVCPANLLDMEEEFQEEHPDGEVGRHGACHMRNNGQVGMQVWPADRHARSVPL